MFSLVIFIVLGGVFLIQGAMGLFTGRVSGSEARSLTPKYTEESIHKYARVNGACMMIAGVMMIVTMIIKHFKEKGVEDAPAFGTYDIIYLVIAGILILAMILAMKFILVKKDANTEE